MKESKEKLFEGAVMRIVPVDADEDHYQLIYGKNLFSYEEIVNQGFDVDEIREEKKAILKKG